MYPKIVLFDGVCNLCNGAVQFIIRRDKQNLFKFASLQSDFAQKLLKEQGFSTTDFDSIILLENGIIFQKSDAILRLLDSFSLPWKLLKVAYIIPRSFRNNLYDLIAKNRYKIFGKREHCMIPNAEIKEKFL